ncbi:MAG: 30S ribosome-binding factor RbfA [Pseudomonadota bacterium]
MSGEYPRSYRVADQIQRELSVLVRNGVKDPGISSMLTISAVDVSRDLSIAKVYVTVLDEAKRESSMEALKRASGFLRSQVATTLRMRSVPQLRFYYDESIERGQKLSGLIDAAVRSDAKPD